MPVETHVVNGVTLVIRSWSCPSPIHPPVVLLAGTGATASDWDIVATDLCRDRTVYAVDARGHGRSDWPGTYSIDLMARDISDLLPMLDVELDLVGHSLGGLVSCKVAAAGAFQLRRLVLEDVGLPHPRPAETPERPEGELWFDWAVVEQIRPEIDNPDPDWRETLTHVRVPTLVIAGGASSSVPQQHVEELTEAVGGASQIVIDAGHMVHATKPKQFIAAVRTFLDS